MKKEKMRKQKALYKITNLINGKIYIGQTVHPNKRWWEHCNRAMNNSPFPIHLAIKKYGKENFSFEVLEWTEDYNTREKELIKQFNSIAPYGYNVDTGGSNNTVLKGINHPNNTLSDETVNAIYDELKANKLSDQKIADKYNTTVRVIYSINKGEGHTRDGEHYPIRPTDIRPNRLTNKQAEEITLLLKTTNISMAEIGRKYNVTRQIIWQINTGRDFHRDIEYPVRNNNKGKECINENQRFGR